LRGDRIFNSYQEFYSLTRPLSEPQRETLLQSINPSERRRLLRAIKVEGWDDLIARNSIDKLLDQIKEDFDEDIVFIRVQVLSGKVTKIPRIFWDYVVELFECYSMKNKWYVFEGIIAKKYNEDWYLLTSSRRREHGKKENDG